MLHSNKKINKQTNIINTKIWKFIILTLLLVIKMLFEREQDYFIILNTNRWKKSL